MNFLTEDELEQAYIVVQLLNKVKDSEYEYVVSFEVVLTDSNGETLGCIKPGISGNYSYYPSEG